MLNYHICSNAYMTLSLQSESVGLAVYLTEWYRRSPKQRKQLLLIIIRSQRRCAITAMKFADLSLEGFADVIKFSISFYAILQAMRDKL